MKRKVLYSLGFLVVAFLIFNAIFPFPKREERVKEEEKYVSEIKFISSFEFDFDGEILRAGNMTLEIPDNWTEKRTENKMYFYPKEEGEENEEEVFCKTSVQVGIVDLQDKERKNIADYIEYLMEELEDEINRRHEIFYIKRLRGLKTTFNLDFADYIILEVPVSGTIYIIESGFIFTEECRNGFEKIINSISIEEQN